MGNSFGKRVEPRALASGAVGLCVVHRSLTVAALRHFYVLGIVILTAVDQGPVSPRLPCQRHQITAVFPASAGSKSSWTMLRVKSPMKRALVTRSVGVALTSAQNCTATAPGALRPRAD